MEQIRPYTKAQLEELGWVFTTADDGYETFNVPKASGSTESELMNVKR